MSSKITQRVFLALIAGQALVLVSASTESHAASPAANAAPVARSRSIGVSLNAPPKPITLIGTDADGDALTYSIVSGPKHGTLSQVNGSRWLYTRDTNYQGRDSFKFKVNDGKTDSASGKIAIVNAPHGIFQLTGGTPWYLNPNVDGLHRGLDWNDIAVTEDVAGWNWDGVDKDIWNSVVYHKQIGLSLKVLSSLPTWLLTNYGVKTYVVPDNGGTNMTMALPWDPVVKQKVMDFIVALAHHVTSSEYGSVPVDGTCAYVVMGGMGIQTEAHMPGPVDCTPHIPDPDNPGHDISIADELALWQQASKDYIATYAANLRTTPYLVAADAPIQEDIPSSTAAMLDVLCYASGSSFAECGGTPYKGFGPLFGVMNWGLNENSVTDYFVNEWISTNSTKQANGFQFISSYDGLIDPTPVLDAGVSLKGHFIEIYADDADGIYAPLIHSYSALLPW